jgi:F420-non-reducing hydrogenase iron-sulfur subunit
VFIADRGDGSVRQARGRRLNATASMVAGHPSAVFVDHAHVIDGAGWLGDYDIVLSSGESEVSLKVGGILLAEPEDISWAAELRRHFRVDVDCDGRARSVDPVAHASETVDPGLVIVPEFGDGEEALRDSISAADSAAMALVLRLSQPTIVHYDDTSVVDETLCGGCASCVRTCAFGACGIDPATGFSHVDERRCQGCGKCVVSCPVGARDVVNSPHDYLVNAIRWLAKVPVKGPRMLGFLCGGCGYPAADRAGEDAADGEETYPASFLPLRIPCGGRLDTLYVLEAFKIGFDGVAVFRCEDGSCRNRIGNVDMDRRMSLLRAVLRSRGLDDDRLRVVEICPEKGHAFTDSVNWFMSDLASPSAVAGGAR